MDFAQKQRQSFSFKTSEVFDQKFAQDVFQQNVGEVNIGRSKTAVSLDETSEMFRNSFSSVLDFKSENADEQPKVLKQEAPQEIQYIGLEKCFAEKQEGDSDRMLAVRNALKEYHEHLEGSPDTYNKWRLLTNIVKACKSYRFLRFSIFKRGEAKKRLQQVIALQEKAAAMAEDEHEEMKMMGITDDDTIEEFYKGDQKDEKGYVWTNRVKAANEAWAAKVVNNTTSGQKAASIVIGGLAFLLYNPIRLAGAAVMAPFWAINEGIRAVERKVTGGWAHRPIKMGWRWTPNQLYLDILTNFYNSNTRYVEIGETNVKEYYWESLDRFKNMRGAKIDKKKSTVEFTQGDTKVKYRVTFDPKQQINHWYRIDEKTKTETEIPQDEAIIINEYTKITKDKVKKSLFKKDVLKRMEADMAMAHGLSDDNDDDDDD